MPLFIRFRWLLWMEGGRCLRILYGGGVKPQNAVELFGSWMSMVVLIGSAALVAEDFLAICRAAN